MTNVVILCDFGILLALWFHQTVIFSLLPYARLEGHAKILVAMWPCVMLMGHSNLTSRRVNPIGIAISVMVKCVTAPSNDIWLCPACQLFHGSMVSHVIGLVLGSTRGIKLLYNSFLWFPFHAKHVLRQWTRASYWGNHILHNFNPLQIRRRMNAFTTRGLSFNDLISFNLLGHISNYWEIPSILFPEWSFVRNLTFPIENRRTCVHKVTQCQRLADQANIYPVRVGIAICHFQ